MWRSTRQLWSLEVLDILGHPAVKHKMGYLDENKDSHCQIEETDPLLCDSVLEINLTANSVLPVSRTIDSVFGLIGQSTVYFRVMDGRQRTYKVPPEELGALLHPGRPTSMFRAYDRLPL